MPVITFSSPKGGAGKTTAACILASMLAEQGATVTIIDADPNQFVQEWAQLPGLPATLQVVGGATEETIMDKIEEAASMTAFVIVDLEGLASLMVSHAISMSDLVVIPVQGSQFDASQAARQIGLIKRTEKRGGRAIPYTVLITRTNPAIMPHTLKHILQSFDERAIPVLKTRLCDREAYRAMFSYGGTLQGLAGKGVANTTVAINNAAEYAAEIVQRLRDAAVGERADDPGQHDLLGHGEMHFLREREHLQSPHSVITGMGALADRLRRPLSRTRLVMM